MFAAAANGQGENGMLTQGQRRHLQDLGIQDVEFPTYAVLPFSVCAADKAGCGWGGWLLEGAFVVDGQVHDSGTKDKAIPAVTSQICPVCGRAVFRTIAAQRYVRAGEDWPCD
jgi:hypothetical protein